MTKQWDFRVNPCGNSKKLSGMFASVDEYECQGHNNSHPTIKKKEGIPKYAKILLGVAAGVLIIGVTAAVTVAVIKHLEKKKYEPCPKCKKIMDTQLEDIYNKDARKSIPALDEVHSMLKTEHQGCQCV